MHTAKQCGWPKATGCWNGLRALFQPKMLVKKHIQTDIARLKIALDELRYLVVPINIKPFRDALQAEYGSDIRIVHERGIQEAYSCLTEPLLIGSTNWPRPSPCATPCIGRST